MDVIVVNFKFAYDQIFKGCDILSEVKRSKCPVDPRSILSVWRRPSPGCWTNLEEPSPSSPGPDPTSSPPPCLSLCSSGKLSDLKFVTKTCDELLSCSFELLCSETKKHSFTWLIQYVPVVPFYPFIHMFCFRLTIWYHFMQLKCSNPFSRMHLT